MTLADCSKNGWLGEHKTTPAEIADLLAIVDPGLSDCRVRGLSPGWRLNVAYNAALQASTAASAACGYRAPRDAHHFRTIPSLSLTIGDDSSLVVRQFDSFRKKRNTGGYERSGTVSEQEAAEMVELAERIRKDVMDWLQFNHPQLFKK